MMKNLFSFRNVVFLAIMLMGFHAEAQRPVKQGDYRAVKDGSWGNPDTWERWNNSRGWQAGLYDYIAPPGRGTETVVIAANVTVFIDDGSMIGTWLAAMRNGGEGREVEYPYACKRLILEPGAKVVSTADHNLVAGSVTYTHPFPPAGQSATRTNTWDSGGYTLRIYGDSILNDGEIGAPGLDGIILEMGPSYTQGTSAVPAFGFRLTGAGTTMISKMRMTGGSWCDGNFYPCPGPWIKVEQDMTVTGAGPSFTALYKPTVSDDYRIWILPGKKVTLTNPLAEIHAQGTANGQAAAGYRYYYKIDGTLDVSASNVVQTFTKLATAGSLITVDVPCPGQLITQFPLTKTTLPNSLGDVTFLPASGACYVVLPLEILSFTAKLNEGVKNEVVLNWSTTNESNTKAFIVERSNDGNNFKMVGTVNARNTSGVHSYSFVDNDPYVGTSFYRLKQLDIDGKNKFSSIQKINAKGKDGIVAYPNPAKNNITVVFDRTNVANIVDVLTMDGRLMMSVSTAQGVTQKSLDISGLQSGYYMLRVQNGNDKSILKFYKN